MRDQDAGLLKDEPEPGVDEDAAAPRDLDASIAISLEELEDDLEIALEGEGPSAEEQHRAYALVGYLRGILPRLTHPADAANAHLQLAENLGATLGDPAGALEASRTAFRRRPRDLHVARAYRKAALRANEPKEVSTALDAESKRTTAAADRAALSVERALLLARHFANDTAASYAFKRALDVEPTNVVALWAAERAALSDEDRVEAGNIAQKLAAASSDPKLRAEHLARAARHLERAGDEHGALALAASARLDAPESPAVLFVLERLCAAQRALGMFVTLRKNEIAAGVVDEASAWFDIGVIAAYSLHDDDLAVEAFTLAAAAAGDEEVCCLEELAWLHQRRGDHRRESDAIADQLPKEPDALARAALWHRLARVRGEHLGDEDGTAVALEAALAEAPSYYPVLADAGRLFHRTGSRDRLINMHRLEVAAASSPLEASGAMRRLGELLVEDEATRDEGIAVLREAHRRAPGHLATCVALERALEAKGAWTDLADLYTEELGQTKEPSRRAHLHTQIGKIAAERLGDPARAIESLRQAALVDTGGGPPPLLVRLADLLEQKGELDELVPLLGRIADETSDKSERATVYERLAVALEEHGRVDDAMLAFKRAVQAAPASHPAHAAAGRAFLRNERHRELLEVLEAGLAGAAPKEKAMWLQRIAAVENRYLGRTDDAIRHLSLALEHAPDAFPARQTLVEILTRAQRYKELGAVLAGASSGSARAALRRGIIAEASGDLSAAQEHYGRALEGGSKLARWPLLRTAAATERWDTLERHYGASTSPASLFHERCRAAEIAHERLQRPADAVRYLTEALGASKRALSPVVSMLPLVDAVPATHVRLLDLLESLTTDPATKLASLRLAAHAWEASGDPDNAVRTHLRVLSLRPADPVSLVAAEIALERRRDRVELAERLRRAARDPLLEPQLHSTVTASLGAVLEQLGQLREAAQAYASSRLAAGEDVSRETLLALYRLHVQLGDTEPVPEVLEALAKCPPAGATQSACRRRLAAWWCQQGEPARAADALRASLAADPRDYHAIGALAELPNVGEGEVIDALTRAFELERDTALVSLLGTTLAARLLLLGRWHTARETVERVLALQPDALNAWMLLAETHERRKSWELAATALERVSRHPEAQPHVQLEALRRLVTIEILHLHQADKARANADRVAELAIEDELGLRAKLEVDILVEDDAAAAKTLAALTDEFEGSARMDDLLRLAALEDDGLHDPRRAVATLTRISESAGHAAAVAGLRTLGQTSANWPETAAALEAALEHAPAPPWECALRRRLAQILREHLSRPEEALEHEKRILELDPSEGPNEERGAHGVESHEPGDDIARHRRLVLEEPERIESYRALRSLFLAADDRDAAFCAEGVLVGLGVATEEEAYFYDQRRAKHAGRVTGALSPLELTLLCPERDDFVVRVQRTVDALVPRMFPLDREGYGVDDERDEAESLAGVAAHAATLFGVAHPRAFLVSPQLGPAVELDDDEVCLFLPRSLDDAPPPEQRFVCGALLARAALGGAVTDPRRLNAFSDNQLDQLIMAALAIGNERHAPEGDSPIYADMHMRLSGALGHISRGRLEAVARQEHDALALERSNELRSIMNRAAARAALLCAGDPAVAIAVAVRYRGMFSPADDPIAPVGPHDVLSSLPVDFRCGLGFAVSDTHAKLRQRLFEVTDDG